MWTPKLSLNLQYFRLPKFDLFYMVLHRAVPSGFDLPYTEQTSTAQ